MKPAKLLKYSMAIGIIGIIILGFVMLAEYESILSSIGGQRITTLTISSIFYHLFLISVFLLITVLGLFSFLLYNTFKKNQSAKEALILSEKRFRTIFEKAPLGIALIDSATGSIYDSNTKYSEIMGRSIEELQTLNWMSLTHPDDLAQSFQYKTIIDERKETDLKIAKRYVRADGSVIYGNMYSTAILMDGRPESLRLCMLEDVTEQKKAEEITKENQEKYRSLVDNATDIIMTVDLEDKITFINYTGGGYTREQVIGGSVFNFVLPEYHELVKKIHTGVKNSKITQSYETVSQGEDGVFRWFLTNVGAILSTDNTVTGLTLFTKDITDRKRIEEALKASENELRSLFSVMDDIIMELGSDGTYLKIAPTNPSLLFDSIESLMGKKIQDVLPENEAKWVVAKINETLEAKKIIHAEYTLSIDSKSIVFEATISPLTEGSVLWVARDITARKHIEEEIIKKQSNFEDAQRLSKIGSWELDLTTLKFSGSKELYRILELDNVTEDNLDNLYEFYKSLCDPKELSHMDDLIKKAIESEEGFIYEHRIVLPNGTVKHISCIGEVIKNKEGKVTGLKGTEQDITERKKMENLLKSKEQNALLVRYAAQVPGVIYQFQSFADGRFVFPYVSEGVYELCGVTVEEVMKDGQMIFNFVHADDLNNLMSSFRASINPLKTWAHDYRVNLPSKGMRWLRGNSKPEKLTDGSVLWHGYLADITETKLAEEALQISKDKLAATFNGSNDAIMLLTRDGFFDCNPKTLEMFGLQNRNEFIKCHPSDLSPPLQPDGQDSRTKANAMIEIAYQKGINRFEWTHQRKNGQIFPTEILVSAFNYGNERVLQATVHDITERKLAEKKLFENEVLLSSILQTLPVAVFGKDIKNGFRFSLWNKKAEEIFGLEAEDCIGKNDYDFFPDLDADWYRKNDEEASKMEGILDIPEEIVVSKNKHVIVHTQKIIVRNSEGEPLILLGVSEDITDRRKAEEKIKKSEEKYRSVVENAADIIITVDSNEIIQFINHTQIGMTTEQIVGKNMYDFIPPYYHEFVKQKIKKIYDTKKSQSYEIQGQHLDGSTAWYSTNAGPVFSGEEVSGITLITRDITERKDTEDKTRHSLKEKEILLKEVHHRVKNNLQIILSILNLQYGAITDKKTLELLRDVRSRIKAMSFIHELLYQTNDFSSINLSEYISNISTNLIYSYTQNHPIDLKLDIDAVFLDLDRAIPCGLIINELLTNALKYAFSDQKEGQVSISLKQRENYIRLIIADNGKGFPAHIDYKNTESLGMQLVITLVQQLRAEIVLDNSNGAKYTITFKSAAN
ncbi:MAG: PAS domain S-box protein [Bacteroidota bacterium]